MNKSMRSSPFFTYAVSAVALLLSGNAMAVLDPDTEGDYELKLLGKYAFFDKISEPERMACVTCHDPAAGGTPGRGVGSGVNLHQVAVTGANPHTIGNIAVPTNIYASTIPAFFADCPDGGTNICFDDNDVDETGDCQRNAARDNFTRYCGGNFWDGRAEGNESAILPGATEHLGAEVFKGDATLSAYAVYFGPTADQALNPMPNPVEQNIERLAVCQQVADSKYASLYEAAWGEPVNCSEELVDGTVEKQFDISFKRIILAICAWQSSKDLNSWSSKRDNALRAELACFTGALDADPAVCADPKFTGSPGTFPLVGLTDQENLGHDLFYSVDFRGRSVRRFPDPAIEPNHCPEDLSDCLPVAQCAFCHNNHPGADGVGDDGTEPEQTYTDHAYHNIGTPANPELEAGPHPGLSGFGSAEDDGPSGHAQKAGDKGGFKTPTVRNVGKIPPTEPGDTVFIRNYTHNGWFKSLESLVHFYNTRDVLDQCEGAVTEKQALAANCWPAPEWPSTSTGQPLIGNLGLTAEQEAAIVAYLRALDDLETPVAPQTNTQERQKKKQKPAKRR